MSTKTALLIIDIQTAMFSDPDFLIYKADSLLNNIKYLIEEAKCNNIPIFYVQHCGEGDHPLRKDTPGWAIHSSITPQNTDIVIYKYTPDSFHETMLQEELEKKGVERLIIVGLHTAFCVDTTCRRAYSLGYDVTLVSDAHSTVDSEILKAPLIIAHHNNILKRFADVIPTEKVSFK